MDFSTVGPRLIVLPLGLLKQKQRTYFTSTGIFFQIKMIQWPEIRYPATSVNRSDIWYPAFRKAVNPAGSVSGAFLHVNYRTTRQAAEPGCMNGDTVHVKDGGSQ